MNTAPAFIATSKPAPVVIDAFTGGVTSAKGFHATGAHIGVKRKRKDLALLWSEVPAQVAAVFTTNVMKAPPILWNQKVVAGGQPIHGIVINSGNANACTGELGLVNAEIMARNLRRMQGRAAGRDSCFLNWSDWRATADRSDQKGIQSTSGMLTHSPAAGVLLLRRS